MRGRKAKPTHLRALDGGADKRTPAAASEATTGNDDPIVRIPKPPALLKGEALAEYKRITAELAKIGLITEIYRGPISAYCQVWARWVDAEKHLKGKAKGDGMIVKTPNGYPIQSPWLAIANKALEQMRALATEFGMTPASLARTWAKVVSASSRTVVVSSTLCS